MEASAGIERISELLDGGGLETSNTSMRIPTALRDAAALAVRELGVAPSATALTTAALRATLEAVVMQAVLDDHYDHHPQARPDLGDLAVAAAELDGHPLAAEPERLRQAAAEIAGSHPAASPDDVLLWAEARAIAAAIRSRTGVSVADAHLGAVIQSAPAGQITVVTSDPGDMRLVAGDRDIT